jgi:hypothetical protein
MLHDVTLVDALEAGARGELAAWVDAFLRATGNNVALADGLLRAPRWWHGPIEAPIAQLIRVVGPEPEMEFHEPADRWQVRIDAMARDLAQGWQPPPLIAEYRSGALSVRDGGHRLAALGRTSDRAWTIVWFNSESDRAAGLRRYAGHRA